MQLDHVTIRTRDLVKTRDFFIDVFGLEEKPRPKTIRQIPGHWLYAGDEPIVHLIGSPVLGPNTSSEAWDHVGFRLSNYIRFRSSLDEKGIRYSTMDLPELNERRLFFHAPCGQLIETVFRETTPIPGEEND